MFKLSILLGALAASACGSAAPPATTPVENASPADSTSDVVAARLVNIKHGPMTYVMDTPPNQLEKAHAALDQSALVTALTAEGIAVTLDPDPELGDTVIIEAGTSEIGRFELHDLAGQDIPAGLLEQILARLPARH